MKFKMLKRYWVTLRTPLEFLTVRFPGHSTRLTRTFLNGTGANGERSILTRKLISPSSRTSRIYSQRKALPTGVIQDREEIITKELYAKYLKEADSRLREITRLRTTIRFSGADLHIDSYISWAVGPILEIEVTDPGDLTKVPEDIILINKDVTNDPRYFESNLALG